MPMKSKEEQREYQRKWIAKRRADYFKDKSCIECGSIDNLELDHINPVVKWNHRIWSYSKVKLEAELNKCQILCHNCHVKKTNITKNAGLKHGTLAGYNYYKCRCINCKEIHREYNYKYRGFNSVV